MKKIKFLLITLVIAFTSCEKNSEKTSIQTKSINASVQARELEDCPDDGTPSTWSNTCTNEWYVYIYKGGQDPITSKHLITVKDSTAIHLNSTKILFDSLKYAGFTYGNGHFVATIDSASGQLKIIKWSDMKINWANVQGKPTIVNYTAGTGIGISSGVITNTAPDQTVTLTGNKGITTIGTYPNFTISKTKQQETATVTTSGSGTATITFANTYGVKPNIVVTIQGGSPAYSAVITSSSATSCTITTYNLLSIIGLAPNYVTINGLVVDVVITEK